MREAGNYMENFNESLREGEVLAISELLEKSKDSTGRDREIRRRELRSMLLSAELTPLENVKKLVEYFDIPFVVGNGVSVEELLDALLPSEENSDVDTKSIDLKETLVPTDGNSNGIEVKDGKNPFQEKKTIERTAMLESFLQGNGIPAQTYTIIRGENDPKMMRKESYVLFVVPSLESMVLVCDEEENVSFVVRDLPTNPGEYYRLTKDELKAHPKVAPHIRWSDQETWQNKVLDALTDPRDIFEKKNQVDTSESRDEIIYESAPEGWLTVKAIADLLGKSTDFVTNHAKKHLDKNSSWRVKYLDRNNSARYHYSPELIDLIREENIRYEPALEGWMTVGGIADLLGRANNAVKIRIEKHLKDHPEWVRVYLDSTKKPSTHYAPELVDLVKVELTEHEPAPEGWLTNNGLAVLIKRSRFTTSSLVEKYREEHPAWFKIYLDSSKRPILHYAPELVDLVKVELTEHEPAPEGWMTVHELGILLGKSDGFIRNVSEKYREEHPTWFKVYLNKGKKLFEHYSPELIDLLKAELTEHEPAPEGWMTVYKIRERFRTTQKRVLSIMRLHLAQHPEWQKDYLDGIGRLRKHLSPELVTIIKKELGK